MAEELSSTMHPLVTERWNVMIEDRSDGQIMIRATPKNGANILITYLNYWQGNALYTQFENPSVYIKARIHDANFAPLPVFDDGGNSDKDA